MSDWIGPIGLFWPALVTAAALGVAGSVVGVFVLLRREALAALAMPQVVAVGAAIGLRMNWPSLPPAVIAVAIAVVLLAWSRRRGWGEWLLPSLFVAGLCLSFLIIAHAGAHVEEMQAMFVGIDVAVAPVQACTTAPLLLLAALIGATLWRRWLLLSQAIATAEVAGLRPARYEVGFLCLLALVLLLGTNALGTVMVLSMLFLPAAAILPWARTIPVALAGAIGLSLLFLLAGWVMSNRFDFQFSQSVGGVGFGALVVLHGVARIVR